MKTYVNITAKEELKLYQELIDAKASNNSRDILANAGEYHAAIAMSKLFDKTNKIVRMVVGSFNGAMSDQANYLDALARAIEKQIAFQIIFLDARNTKSKAYALLLDAQKKQKNIVFQDASKNFIAQLTKNGEIKHFSTFDENKFRFEKDTKKYLALLSFNDPEHTSTLINIFDAEFENSAIPALA